MVSDVLTGVLALEVACMLGKVPGQARRRELASPSSHTHMGALPEVY